MRADKKNRDGAIRFAIPRSIGVSRITDDMWTTAASPDDIRSALIAIA
jgi:3-dehydroquinate synthetase